MEKPLVSVVIPSYNHGRYIREAIESVLTQTYPNLELLISDDCSVDDSAEIIRSFKDERIKTHFFQRNMGMKANIDVNIERAKGKYFTWLPSDDLWAADKLEKQVELLESEKDLGGVFTYLNMIDEAGNLIPETDHVLYELMNKPRTHAEVIRQFFYGDNCIAAMSSLAPMELVAPLFRSGNFIQQLGDYEIWLRLAKKARICIIPERLVYHRTVTRDANMSAQTQENFVKYRNEMVIVHREFFDGMPEKLFMEAFSDMLIKKGSLTKEEQLCEQALLYLSNLNMGKECAKLLTAEKIYQLARDPDTLSVLENTYGFKQEDFNYLMSTYLYGTNIAKRGYEAKFRDLWKILNHSGNKVAVYCPDARFTERLLVYLQDNDPEGFKNIACLVSDAPDKYAGKTYKGIPIVSLETAKTVYRVNFIIIASYEYQEDLYLNINHCESEGIRIKTLFTNAELLLGEYE